MLFFLVSCLSFLLLSKSLFIKPCPNSKTETKMWDVGGILHRFFVLICWKRKVFIPKSCPPKLGVTDGEDKQEGFSLLDLPDLALDSILEKLLPAELCSMSSVCTSLREKCSSDHLWDKHLKLKWGGLIGDAAFQEWQSQAGTTTKASKFLQFRGKRNDFLGYLRVKSEQKSGSNHCLQESSVKSYYLSLESGKFWFPTQVFNREKGHVGFMLSCYDAKLSYDSTADNFVARYPAQGRNTIEEDIGWDKIRAPCVSTPANVLHVSNCLDGLQPSDHIEIQWRKNKEFPYGWWYGVVGHLQSCNGYELSCLCPFNDTVVLEFKQYGAGSQWRRVEISRRDHQEVGDEAAGFYGGIRKLQRKEEVAKWKHFLAKLHT